MTKELISVRNLRWDEEDGRYMVGEFDREGQPTSRAITNEQGQEIRLQLEQAQVDLDRYAQLPPGWPAPTTVPVEIAS